MLAWEIVTPHYRRTYNFGTRSWGYLDCADLGNFSARCAHLLTELRGCTESGWNAVVIEL